VTGVTSVFLFSFLKFRSVPIGHLRFSLLELRQQVLQRADLLDSVASRACPLLTLRGIHAVHFSDLFLIKRMSQPAILLPGRKAVRAERHTLGHSCNDAAMIA
jgi:hypothetical protein